MTDHLLPKARAALDLSDTDRIQLIQGPIWILYSRARDILSRLEELLKHPKINRMPNAVIVGETNNGKTEIARHFLARHPPEDAVQLDQISVPILYINAPSHANEHGLFTAILDNVYAPARRFARSDQRNFQVTRIMRTSGVRMLMIDEFQQALVGSYTQRRTYLNAVKNVGNDLQIPIVAVGTEEVFNALKADPQLSNRFEPMMLPRWKANEEYYRLLATFERVLPLRKPSKLTDSALALRILSLSEGTIGEIVTILKRAAIWAIRTEGECITLKTLERMSYVSPSDRKRRPA